MIEWYVEHGHSVPWAEWWIRLNQIWPLDRRMTKEEEREWFLLDDGSEPVEVEPLSLGFG